MISRVTEEAVGGVEDADAWDARLGWAFGLIADDPAERAVALVRLSVARQYVHDALAQFNEMWRLTLLLGASEQYQERAFLEASRTYCQVRSHSLPDGLWGRPAATDVTAWPGLPYLLLFLEWEARFPQEWTRHAKAWGTKQGLIRDLAVAHQDEVVRAKLVDLIEIVVRRAYRCKDREYVRVARVLDGDDLRGRLESAASSVDPRSRCHAGYVLRLLDCPELPNTPRVWRSWVADGVW